MTTQRQALKRDARTFAAGAACGFLGGAFVVCLIVWQYGNVIGSRAASLQRVANAPAAVDRWKDGLDDAGAAVIEAAHDRPQGTSGATATVPADSAIPSVGPPADSPSELRDRRLGMPVDGISPDQLTRQFTDLRGGTREHEAIDILAPRNTPVRAVEDGSIARLFYSKAGGITVYQFDPSQRYCYYYAHLERYAEGLREGQSVQKGQVLGYVGTSGNAPKDTPHLHFAVFRLTAEKHWWEGTAIDPYDILR